MTGGRTVGPACKMNETSCDLRRRVFYNRLIVFFCCYHSIGCHWLSRSPAPPPRLARSSPGKNSRRYTVEIRMTGLWRTRTPRRHQCRVLAQQGPQQHTARRLRAGQRLETTETSLSHPSRQRLRSSTSDDLCVPAVRLPTVGRRAFSVAGARVWNALPADVTSAPSLFTFRKHLKLHLFPLSYPGLVL